MSAALYTLAAAALLAAGGMLASHQHLATTVHEHPHLAAPVTRVRPRDPHRLLIFVGGLQRSGTTALASALEALPDASGQSFRGLFANLPKDEAEARGDVLRSWRGVTRRYAFATLEPSWLFGPSSSRTTSVRGLTLRRLECSRWALSRSTCVQSTAAKFSAKRKWHP